MGNYGALRRCRRAAMVCKPRVDLCPATPIVVALPELSKNCSGVWVSDEPPARLVGESGLGALVWAGDGTGIVGYVDAAPTMAGGRHHLLGLRRFHCGDRTVFRTHQSSG